MKSSGCKIDELGYLKLKSNEWKGELDKPLWNGEGTRSNLHGGEHSLWVLCR